MPNVNAEFILSDLYYPYSALIILNYIFHTIRIIPAYIADILNHIVITIISKYTE